MDITAQDNIQHEYQEKEVEGKRDQEEKAEGERGVTGQDTIEHRGRGKDKGERAGRHKTKRGGRHKRERGSRAIQMRKR